jgi:hypothetical protein
MSRTFFSPQEVNWFLAYVKVQMSNRFNMLDPRAASAAGLMREQMVFVMENYTALAAFNKQYDAAFPDSKLLAEAKALDEAYASAADNPAEAYNRDLLALVQALRDMVQCFDVSDCPDHTEYQTWLDAKAALEQFEPWLEQDEDPRSMGWVDDKGRP